jgi:hypothetical protein
MSSHQFKKKPKKHAKRAPSNARLRAKYELRGAT